MRDQAPDSAGPGAAEQARAADLRVRHRPTSPALGAENPDAAGDESHAGSWTASEQASAPASGHRPLPAVADRQSPNRPSSSPMAESAASAEGALGTAEGSVRQPTSTRARTRAAAPTDRAMGEPSIGSDGGERPPQAALPSPGSTAGGPAPEPAGTPSVQRRPSSESATEPMALGPANPPPDASATPHAQSGPVAQPLGTLTRDLPRTVSSTPPAEVDRESAPPHGSASALPVERSVPDDAPELTPRTPRLESGQDRQPPDAPSAGNSALLPAEPQRAPDPAAPASPAAQAPLASIATVLPPSVRSAVHAVTGVSPPSVQVRSGGAVAEEARARRADAFTREGVVHLPERTPLSSDAARRLLAHEATHVVQQAAWGARLPGEDTPAGRALEEQARAAERRLGLGSSVGSSVGPSVVADAGNAPGPRSARGSVPARRTRLGMPTAGEPGFAAADMTGTSGQTPAASEPRAAASARERSGASRPTGEVGRSGAGDRGTRLPPAQGPAEREAAARTPADHVPTDHMPTDLIPTAQAPSASGPTSVPSRPAVTARPSTGSVSSAPGLLIPRRPAVAPATGGPEGSDDGLISRGPSRGGMFPGGAPGTDSSGRATGPAGTAVAGAGAAAAGPGVQRRASAPPPRVESPSTPAPSVTPTSAVPRNHGTTGHDGHSGLVSPAVDTAKDAQWLERHATALYPLLRGLLRAELLRDRERRGRLLKEE